MKEILSLTKKPKNKKKIFSTLKITEAGQMTIGILQSNFENFWSSIGKIDATDSEKQKSLAKLQEACSWFCRGIAKYHEVKEE